MLYNRRNTPLNIKKELDEMLLQSPFTHLGDAIYSLLYKQIISLEIPVDAILSDTVIAKELDVSRTPVRGALQRLQDEGLLICKGRSFHVAPLDKDECRHLMELRLAMEGQAAYWAAERITELQLADLKSQLDRYAASCSAWKPDEIVESDHAFHQEIVDAAGNPLFRTVYAQFSPRVLHYRYFLFRQTPRELLEPIMAQSVRHHQSVYDAIRLGFSDTARKQLERDISGMTDIIGCWR